MQLHRFAVCALLLGTLGASACSGSVATAPTTAATATIDTFSGTLTKTGAATYAFATGSGGVTATVTTISPDSAVVIGISMGVWNGSTCQVVLSNDNATQGTVVVGNATTAGNLCIRVYDVGLVVQPEAYRIDVSHS